MIADLNDASALASEIGASSHICDVSKEEAVQEIVAKAVGEYGGLAGAVSCAGIAIAQKVVSKRGVHPLDSFMKVLNVNLGGTFNVARLVAEQLQKQEPYNEDGERGVIINTASVAAFDGQIGQAAYAASKFFSLFSV
jgi:NAD(P)-dependent dehydrogenase (short-subunit alcohol dehydrogenase family)